jgi:hypothetical protein
VRPNVFTEGVEIEREPLGTRPEARDAERLGIFAANTEKHAFTTGSARDWLPHGDCPDVGEEESSDAR